MDKIYDLIILGAGPAGLSAGIYSARSNLDTLIIENKRVGGQIIYTSEVTNYPGVTENTSGSKLISTMVSQCERFGVNIIKDNIIDIDLKSDTKILKSKDKVYKSKSVIIATGGTYKKLNIKNEKELTGKGVSYCAICDADFFTDLEVFVVGSGDSAVKESIYLSKFARKVNLVCRSEKLRCSKYIEEKAKKNSKIEFIFNSKISKLYGEDILEGLELENLKTNKKYKYIANEDDGLIGLFIFIGSNPQTKLFIDKVNMDDYGYIITDNNMKTNISGVFAAGDCRANVVKQVITATSDGAIASIMIQKYIEDKEG